MNNHKKGFTVPLLIVAIAILIIGIGVGTYLYTQNKNNPTVPPQSVANVSVDEYAGWKTFVSTANNFSIKYPENYHAFNPDPSTFLFSSTTDETIPGSVGMIKITPYESTVPWKDYIESLVLHDTNANFTDFSNMLGYNNNEPAYLDSTSTVIIGDNVTGIQLNYKGLLSPYDVVIKNGSKWYRVSPYGKDPELLSVFQKMLKTFRFVIPSP